MFLMSLYTIKIEELLNILNMNQIESIYDSLLDAKLQNNNIPISKNQFHFDSYCINNLRKL